MKHYCFTSSSGIEYKITFTSEYINGVWIAVKGQSQYYFAIEDCIGDDRHRNLVPRDVKNYIIRIVKLLAFE
jgi:hypothetical protein